MERTYAILAAEPSGDLQAAALVPHLRRLDPEARLVGIGGKHLRAAGVELLVDTSCWGTIGLFEVFGRLPKIAWEYLKVRRALLRLRPTVTVMIDSPAVFMRLAKPLAKRSLKTVYYFPPSAWTTNPKRLTKIARRVTRVICTFRRNFDNYCRAGIEVDYFGHPMVEVVQPAEPSQTLAGLGLSSSERTFVALLPGSRLQEIRLMTPVLLDAADILKRRFPNLTFLIPAASERVYELLQSMLEQRNTEAVELFNGKAHEILSISRAAILTSGSVSLEAACLGCPMVLGYKVNKFDYFGVKLLMGLGFLRIDRIALPNLVLNEDILPELLQEQVNPERLAAEVEGLLFEGPQRDRMLHDLRRVKEALGHPPIVSEVAQAIYRVATETVSSNQDDLL